MNILLLTRIYPQPDDRAGYKPTRTVEYFARDWAQAGHRVIVIHCQAKFPLPYYLAPYAIRYAAVKHSYALIPTAASRKPLHRKDGDVSVYRIPVPKILPSHAYSERVMKTAAEEICAILDAEGFRPDLVAGHFANPCMELTARVGERYHARTSFVFHSDCSERTVREYRLLRWREKIDVFGARSQNAVKRVQTLLSLEKTPFICYSGVPDREAEQAEKTCTRHTLETGVNFLYTGGLIKKKHADTVIAAFAALTAFAALGEDEHYRLTVIGSGEKTARKELHRLAERLNVSNRVRFTGEISREEVAEEMRRANVFAMVSEGETFGMVYLEAMLQGCLVVASVGGGFDGIIQDGVNGFLCPPGDDAALAEVFRRILAMTADERNAVGQAAIQTALRFTESRVAADYLNCAAGGSETLA